LSAIKTGLTISTSYQVRYRARNLFGWSASYSDIETIATITEPAMIDANTATVAIVGSNVQINWNVPVSNGSPLLKYEVVFASTSAASPTYVEESVNCDGASTAVLNNNECTIPMSQFWAITTASPMNLVAGDAIKLKLRAHNVIGGGAFTAVITSGILVQTPPATPTLSPVRDEAGTTVSQITATMPEIISGTIAAGSASISSYGLEWNSGSGTTFTAISGDPTESLTRVIAKTSLTSGHSYIFRYRVKNIHGWSAGYSPQVTIVAAKKPSDPVSATTVLIG
jgi:hypothetical protein